MGPGPYTAERAVAAPPLYLQVNVYRSRSGWMCSLAVKQSGGRAPRTNRRLTTFTLGHGDKTLTEAAAMAAEVLKDYSA